MGVSVARDSAGSLGKNGMYFAVFRLDFEPAIAGAVMFSATLLFFKLKATNRSNGFLYIASSARIMPHTGVVRAQPSALAPLTASLRQTDSVTFRKARARRALGGVAGPAGAQKKAGCA
jgi:hypothetical protein